MISGSDKKETPLRKHKAVIEDYNFFGGEEVLDEAGGEFKEQSNLSLCAMLGIDVGKIALQIVTEDA